MDKNYKHATDMEERLRRASDAAIVDKPLQAGPRPRCARCYALIVYHDDMVRADEVTDACGPDDVLCLHCAGALSHERRHFRDPVEDFNPTRWAVLSAVVILVIITLNVM